MTDSVDRMQNECEEMPSREAYGVIRSRILGELPTIEHRGATSIISNRARFRSMIERRMERIARVVGRESGKRIRTSLDGSSRDDDILDRYFGPGAGEYISIHLRVYQSNLALILPAEILSELSFCRSEDEESAILKSLGREERASLAAFISAVLGDRSIFSNQRVYLNSIKCGGLSDERDAYIGRLKALEKKGEIETIGARILVEKSRYWIAMVFRSELCERLGEISRYAVHGSRDSEGFRRAKTYWTLTLEQRGEILSDLLRLRKGKRLLLGNAMGSLRQVRRTSCERARARRTPSLSVELLPESNLGVIKLKIIG